MTPTRVATVTIHEQISKSSTRIQDYVALTYSTVAASPSAVFIKQAVPTTVISDVVGVCCHVTMKRLYYYALDEIHLQPEGYGVEKRTKLVPAGIAASAKIPRMLTESAYDRALRQSITHQSTRQTPLLRKLVVDAPTQCS